MSVFRIGDKRLGTLPDRAAGNSTQRWKKFTEMCIDAGAASQKLCPLCQTRWAVRLASVDAISTAKKEILATLEELGAGVSHLSSLAAWPASCSAHRGLRSYRAANGARCRNAEPEPPDPTHFGPSRSRRNILFAAGAGARVV